MQVSIETTSALERRLTVGVPADRIETEVTARLQKAAKTVRLDGFRPGKVPLKVVKQRFGAGVRQEVIGEVMSQTFYEAVNQESLKPAGQPAIEPKTMEEGKDLEYTATFEVFPEIELGDYSKLNITKLNAQVTDADVDKMIETLRKQQANWAEVERAAGEGDQVNIDFEGTKDGEAFAGGKGEGVDLELGSGRMIPGFEDGIVGLKAGEEKTLALTFPEDYHAEDLKGAAVEFAVKVNSVSEQELPELNDEFFAKYGVSEGGESKFREDIAANMGRELENAAKGKVKAQVMDGLLDSHPEVQVPASLITQEIGVLRSQMAQQFGAQAQSIDLKSILPDEMFTEQAERRVKLGLILNELVAGRNLTADADKVKETIETMASTYEDPEEVVNYYYSNQQQLQQIEAMVLEDTVVETLLADATVTEQDSSYDEVLAPEPPPAEAE
jgi:trigger factor